ncbi:MAG: signal recognition particle protein [Candidatus Cloacimonetes bacterium]|nr:signal recognition particle protein [Candidatus Cloacimonadota bacterium]
MMFEELSEKLDGVLGRFRQRGLLTEPMIREGLREVRRVLLEADVNYQLAKEFLAKVEERALGEQVLKSVQPGQQIVKIVHDELIALLGERAEGIRVAPVGPTVILLAGLQGSGKTTTAAKLAKRLKREGREPMLAALDVQRPAAIDQLETLGRQVSVPVYSDRSEKDVGKLAKAALEAATRGRHRALILDTAGRLQIDDALMQELKRIREVTNPTEVLLVVDAMIGQEAVRVAQGFHENVPLTGVILTKMDGDARGGAALSVRGVTGVPIKFVGVGERPDGLEVFDPSRMAGRILQQGDVVGLVEKAQEAFDVEQTKRLEKKVAREGKFDLEDFLVMMGQLQKMGPLEGLLKMIPGVNTKALKQAKVDPKQVKHIEAIVLSMTPQERKRPEIINGSRRKRIAAGSGRTVQEVNRLLDQFKQMQKLMKQLKGMGMGKMMGGLRGMPRMPGMF